MTRHLVLPMQEEYGTVNRKVRVAGWVHECETRLRERLGLPVDSDGSVT